MSHPNLLVGTSTNDDAAVYKISKDLAAVMTVDFFPPIVDDPYIFGEIAATNSLSDIYAMGAEPIVALNIVGFPADLDISILAEILKGGAAKALEAGIVIAGGHTVADEEPKYGLSVTGLVRPGEEVGNANSQPGDYLVLTKPIGTGIITTAGKQGVVSQKVIDQAISIMSALNKNASEAMIEVGVNACSDITGFGLIGHLKEMIEGSGTSAEIHLSSIPVIEGTRNLLAKGIVPGGTLRNLDSVENNVLWGEEISEDDKLLLCDAQTSGGLLISVPEPKLETLLKNLSDKNVDCGAVVGKIVETNERNVIEVKM